MDQQEVNFVDEVKLELSEIDSLEVGEHGLVIKHHLAQVLNPTQLLLALPLSCSISL